MWKKRVLSIILIAVTFISILPAEQASAADEIPLIRDNASIMGMGGLDWYMQFDHDECGKFITEDGEESTSVQVRYPKTCALSKVTNISELGESSAGPVNHTYAVRSYSIDAEDENNRNNSKTAMDTAEGWGFPLEDGLLTSNCMSTINSLVANEFKYTTADMSGSENVYVYEIIYSSQNDVADCLDSEDDGFIVYRSVCNYSEDTDLFYYGVSLVIQARDSSLFDSYKKMTIIGGGVSPELKAYALYFDDGEETDALCHDGRDALEGIISEWINDYTFKEKLANSAHRAIDNYKSLTSTIDSTSNKLQIVIDVPEGNLSKRTLQGFAVTEGLDVYQDLALTLTYSLGYGGVSYRGLINNLKVSPVNKLFGDEEESEDKEFTYKVKIKEEYSKCKSRPCGAGEVLITGDTLVTVLDYTKHFEDKSDNDSSIKLKDGKVIVSKSALAFGENLQINIDTGAGSGFWQKVTNTVISNSLILRAESKVEEGSAVKLGDGAFYKLYGSEDPPPIEEYPTYIVEGLAGMMITVSEDLNEINYQSDTGDRIAEYISHVVSNSDIEITYNSYSNKLVDWRTLSESTELEVSNIGDLIYLIGYINLLKDSIDVSQITLIVDSSNIVISLDEYSPFSGSWVKEDGTVLESDSLLSDATAFYHINEIDDAMCLLASADIVKEAISSVNSSYLRYNGTTFHAVGAVSSITKVDINEDRRQYVQSTIKDCDGDFMYTGTAMNSLSYAYANVIYGLFEIYYGLGVESLSGFDVYTPFSAFMSYPFSRNDALQNSVYPGEYTDYLARIPSIGTKLPAPLQVLLYNIDYGLNVLDWSSYADENETSSIDVSNWLNFEAAQRELDNIIGKLSVGNMTALEIAESGVYDNVPDIYMNVFKIIINIHQVCDYLAEIDTDSTGSEIAKGWSGSVYNFYQLYEATYSGGISGEKFFGAIEGNLLKVEMEDFTYSNKVEPLGFVLRFGDEQLSSQWKYGYAISSHYVPFKTNVYELSAIEAKVDDSEWVTEFFYKYGFYRKALYVTTDPEATVNRVLTGRQSGTKVATLRDLLSYDHDIELYIDQEFYNSDEVDEQLTKYIQNASENSVFGSIFDAVTVTADTVLKTRGYANYSRDIQANVKPLEAPEMNEEDEPVFKYDGFLLSGDEILGEDGYLSSYEYSIQQPYGVVSAIYRDSEIFTTVDTASVSNEPVCVSSKNVLGIQKANYSFYRMFYNYLTLSSLDNIISKETTLLLDLDAPIFIDIFGNIVTADGYVIIPAAANATLAGEEFTPYSVGYATFVANAPEEIYKDMPVNFYDWFYGADYEYISGRKSISYYSRTYRERCQATGGGFMYLLNSGRSSMGTTTLTDGVASTTVIWDNLNTRIAVLKNLLVSVHYLNAANFYDSQHINLIIETLRGAPIEFIDLDKEGLNTSTANGKVSAYIAYKFEQIMNAIHTDSNGTVKDNRVALTFSILDIFHIESAEKVALLAVKCLLIGFLLLLAAMIVADATVGKMPLKIVGNIVITCVLTGTCISLIPVLTEFSLSTVTKKLLQAECSEILTMQTQRNSQGIEIGVTQTYPVSSSTNIVLHIGSLDVTWYDKLLYSAYSNIDNSFEDLYDERAYGIPIANAPYTVRRGKELYMDTGKVMASTTLQFDATKGLLTNSKIPTADTGMLSASYILPYYVILDQLVANVNLYNEKNGIQPMTYSVNADGSIRTQDLCYAYFHSPEFLGDDYDVLDMARWFNFDTEKIIYAPYYTDSDIKSFSMSYWYPVEADADNFKKSVDKLYEKARAYVNNNSEMLNYVSDAAYLKSFAMYLAVQYNNIFGVGTADAFEVKCIDTADLVRYVVGTPNDVYKFANRTLPRFAHEAGGSWTAFWGMIVYVMFCITNIVRVLSFILCYITCCGSIIYHRVLKREESASMLGFLVLIGELTILNLVFAVTVKVSVNLTRWGLSPSVSAVTVILLNALVAGLFLFMNVKGLKNVTHLGKSELDGIKHFFNNISNRVNGTNTGTVSESGPERSIGVLQAHDFSRVENDNYMNTDRDTNDLAEHDRRRESGELNVS